MIKSFIVVMLTISSIRTGKELTGMQARIQLAKDSVEISADQDEVTIEFSGKSK